jgi:FAD-dependent urate hydroxylase
MDCARQGDVTVRKSPSYCTVAIIGAGPYGLSIAAHLRQLGVEYRIVGSTMESWRSRMPKGMLLKSAGFASNLSDRERTFTLRRFCMERASDYDDLDFPIPLEQFSAYGQAFQKRLVPEVENEELASLIPDPGGFELRMSSGRSLRARKVVLAVGLDYFRHVPEPLAGLSRQKLSHVAEHHDLGKFQGQRVAILGSGASAVDIAVLLHEAQASVQLIARKPALIFSGPWGGSGSHPFLRPILIPVSGIGPGWKHRIFADLPWLYRYVPDCHRRHTAERFPGPSAGLPMKNRAAPVPKLLGYDLQRVNASGCGVQLRLSAPNGSICTVEADHVIAATGYKSDVHRLPFLSPAILERLRLVGTTPRLSRNFESSVPGLYFAGPVAATTFGPVMRFVFGADFTSRTIARHFARRASG